MKVLFKKLHEKAVLPAYGTEYSAGMDLVPTEGPTVKEKFIEYKFGFAMELPEGYAGFIFPRSSISKTDLSLCNAVGIIDCDYRGEVMARFNYVNYLNTLKALIVELHLIQSDYHDKIVSEYMEQIKMFKEDDAILQMVIMPVPKIESEWADELSDTVRGAGGFGHTDKK